MTAQALSKGYSDRVKAGNSIAVTVRTPGRRRTTSVSDADGNCYRVVHLRRFVRRLFRRYRALRWTETTYLTCNGRASAARVTVTATGSRCGMRIYEVEL